MDDNRRVTRVENTVRQSVSTLLLSEYRQCLHGIVTISHVKMPKDLRQARVFISVLGSEEDSQETMESLESIAWEVQGRLGKTLGLRYTPTVVFQLDRSGEEAARITGILSQIRTSSQTGE